MKCIKKLVALTLAAVLALAMLTACYAYRLRRWRRTAECKIGR